MAAPALGCNFDVDVASPGQDVTPWIPAKVFITSNSLQRPWVGFDTLLARSQQSGPLCRGRSFQSVGRDKPDLGANELFQQV
jgi:hypothetical protein